jgi:mannosyltransferase OCH1-like enzyme
MIPKKIHYCWFGGNPLPKDVQKYIDTWRKFCPDYEIKEWNEQNFDIHLNRYVEEAYQQKKWAFVSDVARIYALYTEGGIYMDTDVEVVRNLDPLLNNRGFLGFEGTQWIATNIVGFESNHELLKQFLDSYNHRVFLKQDGSLDQTTNVEELTKLLIEKYSLKLNGKQQVLLKDIMIYPTDYFSPYDYIQGKLNRTPNTYSIHWFSQTWVGQSFWRKKIAQIFHRIIGTKMK